WRLAKNRASLGGPSSPQAASAKLALPSSTRRIERDFFMAAFSCQSAEYGDFERGAEGKSDAIRTGHEGGFFHIFRVLAASSVVTRANSAICPPWCGVRVPAGEGGCRTTKFSPCHQTVRGNGR